jgi:hypothetical protein
MDWSAHKPQEMHGDWSHSLLSKKIWAISPMVASYIFGNRSIFFACSCTCDFSLVFEEQERASKIWAGAFLVLYRWSGSLYL